METDVPAPPPESSFSIVYEEFAGSLHNLDLRGKGTLAVRPGGPQFIFSGTKRQVFSFSRVTELTFNSDQIWNVAIEGRRVQFATRAGESGHRNKPFVFFCRTAEEAAAVGALLPPAKEVDFIAGHAFGEKLRELHGTAKPWTSVTNLIIAANVAVFIVMGLLGAGWIEVESMMPYIRYGANNGALTTDGEWWRLVTSMFVHYGVIHLLLNMWALFQTGHLVERLFGRTLYTLGYFGSGIIGSLVTLLWHGDKVWSAGASGAVFGVYGMVLGYMWHEKHALPKSVFQPLVKSTLTFAGYNLFYGLINPRIDNAAHIGGLLGGVALGWILAVPVDREARAQLVPQRLRAGVAALALAITAGVILAPRFDYRLMDEFAWSDALKAPVAKEPEVLKHQQTALTAFQKTKNSRELLRWLPEEAIPFYGKWRQDVMALKLEPDRRTDRRRVVFAKILQMKVDSYEHLLGALKTGEDDALPRFQAEERDVVTEVKKLSAFAK